jgi:hypothetical protein
MNPEIDKSQAHVQAVATETMGIESAIPERACLIEQGLEPFTLVILGATG